MPDRKLPSVTVAIPAFNEEHYIEGVIRKFQASNYPNIIEILIADGRSTDKTAEIIDRISQEDPRVRRIDNPDKIQSAGLNRIIQEAKGEYLLRADAHCVYSDNYIEASVDAALKSGALNTGGAQRFIAETPFQSYIALAVRSLLGSGGARYRDETYTGYADTVFIGCYKTDVVRKLGGFRTDNGPNEDTELNLRLQNEQEQAIYISSDIAVWYYPRKTLKSLFIQYFRYGKGRCITVLRHLDKSALRGSIPFLFLLIFLILIGYLLAAGKAGAAFIILGVVTGLTVIEVFSTVLREKDQFSKITWKGTDDNKPGFLGRFWGTLTVVVTMNIAHFLGFGWQVIRSLFGKRNW
jgi:glycosyltransferase involved in cell wall biosynthesis